MSIATKVAHNYIIQVIAKFIATALGLITMALITRHLGIEEFGRYTIIITILSFFGILADLGLTLVTVQMISQKNTDLENTLSKA
ncbi:MAG: oligosaccharide flippase family protein [Candidatus Falkowbacteria bacterium]|nr:oligosaccharide flippase family protein [Candidatus Falkowbacteria bacterium]